MERVRSLAGGPFDQVLDTSRPNPGAIATLIEIAGDPKRVVTISNHDEGRARGARVNIDELIAAGGLPRSDFLAEYATLAAAGRLTVPVAKTFPLDQWRTAAAPSLSGSPHGKVVLVP